MALYGQGAKDKPSQPRQQRGEEVTSTKSAADIIQQIPDSLDPLAHDEKVICQGSVNPVALFAGPLLWLGVVSLVCSAGEGTAIQAAWLFFGVIPTLGWTGLRYLELLSTFLVVTDKRILTRTGVLNQSSTSIALSKVEAINVKRQILDLILRTGTICVTGTGGSNAKVKYINNYTVVRSAVRDALSR